MTDPVSITVDGDDGRTVTVRVPVKTPGPALVAAGLLLAHRPSRDAPVSLGNGVSVYSGGFYSTGGTRKRPQLNPRYGTVLEVRGVHADRAATITHRISGAYVVADTTRDREALLAERAQLLQRVADIDNQLTTTQDANDTGDAGAVASGAVSVESASGPVDLIDKQAVIGVLADCGRPITAASIDNYRLRPPAGWPQPVHYVGRTPLWSEAAIRRYGTARLPHMR